MHLFEIQKDGQLRHSTDGELRATVPPESWKEYCEVWPDAKPVCDAATLPSAIATESTSGNAFPPM